MSQALINAYLEDHSITVLDEPPVPRPDYSGLSEEDWQEYQRELSARIEASQATRAAYSHTAGKTANLNRTIINWVVDETMLDYGE